MAFILGYVPILMTPAICITQSAPLAARENCCKFPISPCILVIGIVGLKSVNFVNRKLDNNLQQQNFGHRHAYMCIYSAGPVFPVDSTLGLNSAVDQKDLLETVMKYCINLK